MQALPFVIMPIAALVAYREANAFQKRAGQAPWSVPPLAWAGIAGVSLALGVILLTVAKRTTSATRPEVSMPRSWSSQI